MLSSVEQAFVERDEERAPLKAPTWEARWKGAPIIFFIFKKNWENNEN